MDPFAHVRVAGVFIDEETRDLIRLCEKTLRRNPDDPDALFTKAAVLAGIGFHTDALACINVVSSQVEDYPGLGHFRHRVLSEMRTPAPTTVARA